MVVCGRTEKDQRASHCFKCNTADGSNPREFQWYHPYGCAEFGSQRACQVRTVCQIHIRTDVVKLVRNRAQTDHARAPTRTHERDRQSASPLQAPTPVSQNSEDHGHLKEKGTHPQSSHVSSPALYTFRACDGEARPEMINSPRS
jgi:hypothetical protein